MTISEQIKVLCVRCNVSEAERARHRMIIVGIRKDLPYEFKIPSPEPYKDVDVTCKTAIEKPPIPQDVPNNELTKQSAQVIECLSYINPG